MGLFSEMVRNDSGMVKWKGLLYSSMLKVTLSKESTTKSSDPISRSTGVPWFLRYVQLN